MAKPSQDRSNLLTLTLNLAEVYGMLAEADSHERADERTQWLAMVNVVEAALEQSYGTEALHVALRPALECYKERVHAFAASKDSCGACKVAA